MSKLPVSVNLIKKSFYEKLPNCVLKHRGFF